MHTNPKLHCHWVSRSEDRDLINDDREAIRNDVARAIKSREMVISGLHQLLVGGTGATARLAFDRGDGFWGLVNLNLDLPPILAEVGIAAQKNLRLALRDGRGRVLFGERAVFDDNPVVHRIELPEGHWELAAIPVAGWSAAMRRNLATFDIGVLASALLLSGITYLVAYRERVSPCAWPRVLGSFPPSCNTERPSKRSSERRGRAIKL